jgi:hypothetical protein
MELKDFTVNELRYVCKDKQFKNYSKKKKDELIDEITERFADISFITVDYVQSLKDAKIKKTDDAIDNPNSAPIRFQTLSMKLADYISVTPYEDELKKLDNNIGLDILFNMIKDELPGFINSNNLEFIDWKKYVDSKDCMKFMLEYNNEKKNPLKGDYEKAHEKLGKFIYKKEIKEFVSVDATSKNKPIYYRLLMKFKRAVIKFNKNAKRAESDAIKSKARQELKGKTRLQRKLLKKEKELELKNKQDKTNSDDAEDNEEGTDIEEEEEIASEIGAESDADREEIASETGAESDADEEEVVSISSTF